jgi:hypothetical protein
MGRDPCGNYSSHRTGTKSPPRAFIGIQTGIFPSHEDGDGELLLNKEFPLASLAMTKANRATTILQGDQVDFIKRL